jgi:hypothetical protein
MEKGNEKKNRFLGTYFDPDLIFRLSNMANVLAWVVLAIYSLDFILQVLIMVLQIVRGFWIYMGPTDIASNILIILERPFRGLVYYIVLLGISYVLKIFVDIEENTRRIARK